jgi:hypothetical protein
MYERPEKPYLLASLRSVQNSVEVKLGSSSRAGRWRHGNRGAWCSRNGRSRCARYVGVHAPCLQIYQLYVLLVTDPAMSELLLTHNVSEYVGDRCDLDIFGQPHVQVPRLSRGRAHAHSRFPSAVSDVVVAPDGYSLVRDLQVPLALDRVIHIDAIAGLLVAVHPLVEHDLVTSRL